MSEKMMEYCMFCGTRLYDKELEGEGKIPFCDSCGEYRFPLFSTAVSMIVLNQAKNRIMLIKQYGRDRYILVAGYVNKGRGRIAERSYYPDFVNKFCAAA